MTENLRETFRIHPEDFDALLRWRGYAHPCTLVNMSVGGARISLEGPTPQPGEHCTLVVQMGSTQVGADALPTTFELEVLEAGDGWLRLRTMQPDALTQLVSKAQRMARARETGADEASPMASDEERRQMLRTDQRQRFSRGSLRPDQE